MANYIHVHETTPFTLPSHVDFTFLLINYVPAPPAQKQLEKFKKIVDSHTPLVSHLVNLYIHNKIRVQQTTLNPTVEERKMINAAIRRIEHDTVFANWYITSIYIPARIPPKFQPHYRKLVEFITNTANYDFTNPAIWTYHAGLQYYVIKANVLYSLQLPLGGPTFWICKNARDKYFSLVEVCSVFSCGECKKSVNMTIDPIMFRSNGDVADLPGEVMLFKSNAWEFMMRTAN